MTLKDKVCLSLGNPYAPKPAHCFKPYSTNHGAPLPQVLCDYTFLSAMDTETLDSKQREVAHAWFTSPSFIASMIPLSNGSIEELHDSLTLLDDV